MIDTVVVLGATGDLTGRLLLPALAALRTSGDLGDAFRLVGAGHQDWTAEQFAAFARDRLTAHALRVPAADKEWLLARLSYRQVDVGDPESVAGVIAAAGSSPMVVYLALPTQLMLGAVRAVIAAGLPSGSRLAVEKPFGHDLSSAVELNAELRGLDDSTRQPAVYRVDHALAMTAVQQLSQERVPGTRRPIQWDSNHIEQIELLWEESLALEGRAAFFDGAGALRDVMQNHLLQLLLTIGVSPHPDFTDAGDDSRRPTLLRSIRPLDATTVRTRTRRGRYTAGRLADDGDGQGRQVPDYEAEQGVDPARQTETFAEVVLEIDSPRWRGTRFVLRAGKALNARRRGVRVQFRAQPGQDPKDPAFIDVDRPTIDRAASSSDAASVDAEPAAYLQVVQDLLSGGSRFAVGPAEAELGWQVFEPVLQEWSRNTVPLLSYPAGSPGPR